MSRPTLDDAAKAFDDRVLAFAGEQAAATERTGGLYAALDGRKGAADARHALAGFDLDAEEVNRLIFDVARNSLPGLEGAGILGTIAGAAYVGLGVGLMLAELRRRAEAQA